MQNDYNYIKTLDITYSAQAAVINTGSQLQKENSFNIVTLIEQSLILRLDPNWDRESYLEWRADWKAAYHGLTAASRHLKTMRKPLSENVIQRRNLTEEQAIEFPKYRVQDIRTLGIHANVLMQLRMVSKRLAAAAYDKREKRVNS